MTVPRAHLLAAILSVLLLACSSSSDDAAAFVGMWTYTSGNAILTCNGQSTTNALTGGFALAEGSSPDELVFTGPACVVDYTVSGDVATAGANQSCTATTGGVTDVGDFTESTLTLAGVTLSESVGTTNVLTSTTGTQNCTGTITGTAAKAM